MTRRDLMKFFGVGAVVAPVVGGAANMGAQARLIEVPKVELAGYTTIENVSKFDLVDVTRIDDEYRRFMPVPRIAPGAPVEIHVNGVEFPCTIISMEPYAHRDGVAGMKLDIVLKGSKV